MEHGTRPGRILRTEFRRLVGRLTGCESDHLLLERVSQVIQDRRKATYDACELGVGQALHLNPTFQDEQLVVGVAHCLGLEVVD